MPALVGCTAPALSLTAMSPGTLPPAEMIIMIMSIVIIDIIVDIINTNFKL